MACKIVFLSTFRCPNKVIKTVQQPPVLNFRTATRTCSTMAGSAAISGNTDVRTFQLEDTLPSLPVPPLDKTLQRYLASVEPVLTPEEFQKTAQIVADFEKGDGRRLQEKLVQKAHTSRNWMEKWWEEKAYMETRAPAAVLCNIVGGINSISDIWPPQDGTQLERAAIFAWYTLSHFLSVRREEIPVDRSRDGKTVWSMIQLRGLYSTGRKPGIERDTLYRHFKTVSEGACPDHLVVICNGHLYKLKPFTDSGELLSSHDLFRQLSYMKEHSSQSRGQGIGALSADDRTSYAKAYDHLCELDQANAQHLKTMETAIFLVQLDKGTNPHNMTELYTSGLCGPNLHNRYFDKVLGIIVYENGTICCNGDHAPADGIVLVNLLYWIHQNLITTAGAWAGSNTVTPNLAMPEELLFTVDDKVKADLAHASETYAKNASDVELVHECITHLEEANNAEVMHCQNASMGKKWIRAEGYHPDAFLQLAFQYTYYRMYNKAAPTYESATTRKYYHGRTETVRSCTTEALTWTKAMMDKSKTNADKLSLFKAAHEKHLALLKECANGEGCDRHLLGLFILAKEEGIVPDIFTDPAFTKSGGGGNFVLSTSLTGYVGVHGMVMAMTYDGYGIFYCFTDDSIVLNIAGFKSCPETDVRKFFQQLNFSLLEMQRMLVASKM